jgi:hypothetical protein
MGVATVRDQQLCPIDTDVASPREILNRHSDQFPGHLGDRAMSRCTSRSRKERREAIKHKADEDWGGTNQLNDRRGHPDRSDTDRRRQKGPPTFQRLLSGRTSRKSLVEAWLGRPRRRVHGRLTGSIHRPGGRFRAACAATRRPPVGVDLPRARGACRHQVATQARHLLLAGRNPGEAGFQRRPPAVSCRPPSPTPTASDHKARRHEAHVGRSACRDT